MTSKSRNSSATSAEGSPRLRVIKVCQKSHPQGRNRGDAAIKSKLYGNQEPLPSTRPSLRSESATTRATQNA